MKNNKIVLPRVYSNNDPGVSGKFPQHEGKPKISYSQYNSWLEDSYRGAYIGKYFIGVPDDGNIFTSFGGFCGEYLEKGVDESGYLDKEDIKWLDTVERPENAEYEREIVLDRGNYVTQGFIDQNYEVDEGMIVIDFKTGGDKKKVYYASKKYQQTTLYCKALVEEGEKIHYSGVQLLPRKGNKLDKSADHPMRLVGKPIPVPTPYSEERAEAFIKELDKVTEDISNHYQCYLRFFG